MSYSNKVLDHYENPRNVGSFDNADPAVGTGLVGSPIYYFSKLHLEIKE